MTVPNQIYWVSTVFPNTVNDDFHRWNVISQRQTGRTSDMLWGAANAKSEGARVLIVVHEQRMIDHCLRSLRGDWWGLEREDFSSVQEMLEGRRFDTRYFSAVYIDHFVEEWAKYDDKVLHTVREFLMRSQQPLVNSCNW